MQRAEQARAAWWLWCSVLVLAYAAAFYVPAWRLTAPMWPAPLDDTYIYFGHARSWALGHPFAWYPGNGYSSGATSVLYPMVLAPLWAAGLRGADLGLGAAAIAVFCALDLARSLARLCRSTLARFAAPLLVVAVPLVGWSWWSGMETALFGALLGRALWASERSLRAAPHVRRACQRRAGLWLALVALTRPEALVLVAAVVLTVVYRARSLKTWPSLARAGGPALIALFLQAVANRALTGEWSQAGAVRKLLWSSPHLAPSEAVARLLENLVVLVSQGFVRAFGGGWPWLVIGVLAVTALRRRDLALPLLAGTAGGLGLVIHNATARFQNFRYVAPMLLMLLVTMLLGLDAMARRRRGLAVLAALVIVGAPLRELAGQAGHFARASRNIAQQHGVIAARLRALSPRRVLLNDAGAIPYLAEVAPLDGLGLGGFRGLPFARASVHSVLAVVELIERLPAHERPDLMALYPGWWPGVADVFGERIDAVRIDDNVICAAEEKVILRADWSTLAPPGLASAAIDRLDVADLVSERAHGFRLPAVGAGYVVAATLELPDGTRRWDAGRTVPASRSLSFRLADSVPNGPAVLQLRIDDGPTRPRLRVEVRREGRAVASVWLRPPPAQPGKWRSVTTSLTQARAGDRVFVTPEDGEIRVFATSLFRFGHAFAP
jgi:hypothetical protein